MKTEEINMKDFLSAVQMGDDIFTIYLKHTINKDLREKIIETKTLFANHINELQNFLEKEEYTKNVELKLTQKFTKQIEKCRVKHFNDLALCLEIINSLNKAATNAISFINNNQDKLKADYVDYLKNIVLDYKNLISLYIDFVINIL